MGDGHFEAVDRATFIAMALGLALGGTISPEVQRRGERTRISGQGEGPWHAAWLASALKASPALVRPTFRRHSDL